MENDSKEKELIKKIPSSYLTLEINQQEKLGITDIRYIYHLSMNIKIVELSF